MTIKRRQLLKAASGIIAASTMLTEVARARAADSSPPGAAQGRSTFALSVQDFGASGNATADVTAAFQSALDECSRQGGGVVEVPAGRYLICGHLTIPTAVTLEGVFRAPSAYRYEDLGSAAPNYDLGLVKTCGSVLLAVEGAGDPSGTPFISLNTNATLKGLTIYYPNQTDTNPPVAYPWTVAVATGGADDPAIIDVLLVNPYMAVDFGSYACTRPILRNLFGTPLFRGIYVDNCFDIGRLENVHLADSIWKPELDPHGPAQAFSLQNGQGFIFGRCDWLHVTNCFAIGYKVAFRFTKTSPPDTTRGGPTPEILAQIERADYTGGIFLMTGGGADVSEMAVLIEDSFPMEGISFVNCIFAGFSEVKPMNRGMVRFTACGFVDVSELNTPLVSTAGAGRVSFSNCSFDCSPNFHKGRHSYFVHASGGRLGIVNCTFTSADLVVDRNHIDTTSNSVHHIVLDPDVRSAIILANDFSGRAVISNRSKGKVKISSNVDETGV